MKLNPDSILIPVQEVEKCGSSFFDDALERGPLHIVEDDRPICVMMKEADCQEMVSDLAELRIAASEADIRAGRVKQVSVESLLKDILDNP